jgi:hypothetical protein
MIVNSNCASNVKADFVERFKDFFRNLLGSPTKRALLEHAYRAWHNAVGEFDGTNGDDIRKILSGFSELRNLADPDAQDKFEVKSLSGTPDNGRWVLQFSIGNQEILSKTMEDTSCNENYRFLANINGLDQLRRFANDKVEDSPTRDLCLRLIDDTRKEIDNTCSKDVVKVSMRNTASAMRDILTRHKCAPELRRELNTLSEQLATDASYAVNPDDRPYGFNNLGDGITIKDAPASEGNALNLSPKGLVYGAFAL